MTDAERAYAQRQGVIFAVEAIGGVDCLSKEQCTALNDLIEQLDKQILGIAK